MNVITYIVIAFSLLGAVDYMIGSKLGLGKEFERAFSLFGPMALSMLGMIVIAPAIGVWLMPLFEGVYRVFGIDPSVIPASVLANDMGGMQLAQALCRSETVGNYNAFVVSSMMGCVISFTVPFSLGIVQTEQRKDLFCGLLCGIVTIPVGCFAAGLLCRIPLGELLWNLMPLVVFALLIGTALLFCPRYCIKGFAAFGYFMKALSIVGLGCAVFTFLTGTEISPHFDTLENAALICVNACVTLSGMLPAMCFLSKLLHKPLNRVGARIGLNSISTLALLGTLVTNASTFGMMEKMDRKGVVLNGAFAVSAAFTFGSHLAFTMAFDSRYIGPMIAGKLISGLCGLLFAGAICKSPETEK